MGEILCVCVCLSVCLPVCASSPFLSSLLPYPTSKHILTANSSPLAKRKEDDDGERIRKNEDLERDIRSLSPYSLSFLMAFVSCGSPAMPSDTSKDSPGDVPSPLFLNSPVASAVTGRPLLWGSGGETPQARSSNKRRKIIASALRQFLQMEDGLDLTVLKETLVDLGREIKGFSDSLRMATMMQERLNGNRFGIMCMDTLHRSWGVLEALGVCQTHQDELQKLLDRCCCSVLSSATGNPATDDQPLACQAAVSACILQPFSNMRSSGTWDALLRLSVAGKPEAQGALEQRGDPEGSVNVMLDTCMSEGEPMFSGVKLRTLSVKSLQQEGWEIHLKELYTTVTVQSKLRPTQPSKWLLVGAREKDSDLLLLAAMAHTEDVLKETSSNTPHMSNGTYWYLEPNKGFGFSATSRISLSIADATNEDADYRLNWLLDGRYVESTRRGGVYDTIERIRVSTVTVFLFCTFPFGFLQVVTMCAFCGRPLPSFSLSLPPSLNPSLPPAPPSPPLFSLAE